MEARSLTISENTIDPDIKFGDIVRLHDGSALCLANGIRKNIYIINSYPEIFKNDNREVREIEFTVIKTGITDRICYKNQDWCYLTDIIIQCGGVQLYTCSRFVHRI